MGQRKMPKYAIMVLFDKETDDWLYVTEDNPDTETWTPRPVLFETIEEAFEHAAVWYLEGKEENVSIVEYDEES